MLRKIFGLYYILGGLWPLFSMSSFEAVSGPKTDKWLVRSVGLLMAVIGASVAADRARHPTSQSLLLEAGLPPQLQVLTCIMRVRAE